MSNPLPPMPRDPIGENHKWREWFNVVRNSIVGVAGSVPITHNSLSSTQGGTSTERYHLTLDQHTNLTDAGDTTLHYHATDRDSDNFTGTEWTDLTDGGGTTLHTHGHNSQTGLQGGTTDEYYHNTAHEDALTDIIDTQWSTGVVGTGNLVTDSGSGTVDIASSSVLLRATDSDLVDIAQYTVPAITGQALTDLQNNYIYAEYNAGVPQYIATTTQRTDTNTNVLIARVYRNGNALHINNYAIVRANDNMRRVALRLVETQPTAWAEGVMLSATGTRNIGITAGVLWQCTNKILISAFDSSAAGTFTYAYRDGVGGWTEQAAQTQINNTQYDDGSGTLQTLTANRYAVAWVYVEVDNDVVVLYGQGDYTLIQANSASIPESLPPRITAQGILVGKIVIQKSAAAFLSVESAFTVSLTTSIVNDHEQLAGLLGGGANDHYHLTGTQHTDLTDGGVTTLHEHEYSTVIFPAVEKIGSPVAISTLQDQHDYMWSSGVISGNDITDNGDGTVAVSAGESLLRVSASEPAHLELCVVPANASLALTDNDSNYIYADYNAGVPVVAVTTDVNGFNCLDKCLIGVVGREGTHLHIISAHMQNVDSNRKHRRKLLETIPFAHVEGGCIIGTSGRFVSLTAGAFWFGLEKITHDAFDTSGTDTISTYYRATPSGWTKTTGVTEFPNTQYDDGSGTLATLGNNKFGALWLYVAMGAVPHFAMVYGQAEYASAADASMATEPSSLPPVFESTTLLVGRIIFEKSATSATAVDSPFHNVFGNSAVTVHNNLSALQGGTLNEYYHLTAAQNTDLTDGGDSTNHYHASDRSLANTTGLGSNVATFLATPSETNLDALIANVTGNFYHANLFTGDADTLVTPGRYRVGSSATNTPAGVNGEIDVHTSSVGVFQVFYRMPTTALTQAYHRSKGGAWTAWERVTTVADKLSAFAATTSAELAGVLSDELGTGNVLFGSEGTFTPVLRDAAAGTAATSAGGSLHGRYQLLGNRCRGTINFVNIDTTGLTAGNQVFITGLPFSSKNLTNNFNSINVRFTSASTATGTVQGYVQPNAAHMLLEKTTTTGAAILLVSDLSSTTADLNITFDYEIA